MRGAWRYSPDDNRCAVRYERSMATPSDYETPLAQAVGSKKLLWEARARITWGDPADQVLNWLVEQGADRVLAGQVVESLVSERAKSMRQRGARDLLIGTSVAVVCGLAMTALIAWGGPLRANGFGVVFGAGIAGSLYAVNLLVRGAERVIRGARVEGADSDIDDL